MTGVEAVHKPSSVIPEKIRKTDGHLSGKRIAPFLKRPNPGISSGSLARDIAQFPYLVLLRMGLTMPSRSPETRRALTAPFHPYLSTGTCRAGRYVLETHQKTAPQAVSFLWCSP